MANTLYFGDNLDILRTCIGDESVDLIYLDPPFNSQAQYNLFFERPRIDMTSAQAGAFRDTWRWGEEAELSLQEVMRAGGLTARLVEALRSTLRESDLMAYLVMMTARLQELHRKLKPDGSLYLHCDPTASHYLKLLLDSVFGFRCFRNEIIWKRTTTHSDSRTWSRVHDILLFYTKSDEFTWNIPREAHSEEYLEAKYRYDDGDGRRYMLDNMTSPNPRPNMMYTWKGFPSPEKGWRYETETMARLDSEGRIWYPKAEDGSLDTSRRPRLKRYLEEMEGGVMGTVWTDISPINSQARERLGYPTQKPLALLNRIIAASSNPGHVVLDPFCGCGTTIEAAERAGRQWIGIDVAVHAIKLIEARLKRIDQVAPYRIEGMPRDFESALRLAERDKYQFQWWANYLFNPHAIREQKKGADRGIDGELFFPNGPGRPWGRLLTSVKGGDNIGPAEVRDFARVLDREKAEMGLFICLRRPTKAMSAEASAMRLADTVHGDIPRLQIVAIEDWFERRMPVLPPLQHLPSAALATTRRRAKPTAKRPDPRAPELPLSFSGGKTASPEIHLNPAMVDDLQLTSEELESAPRAARARSGGRKRPVQPGLNMDEPLLTPTQPARNRRGRK